ncbi:MAG: NADH-quinone oxidoreductase subunit C [Kineosporiaceae bacterium]
MSGTDSPSTPTSDPGPLLVAPAGAEAAQALAAALAEAIGEPASGSVDAHGVPVLEVTRGAWVDAGAWLHDVAGLTFADWLSAVDMPDADPAGVDVVAHVARPHGDPTTGRVPRVLLRTRVPEADLRLASLTDVWPGLAWHERETFEMFGVVFDAFDDPSGLGLRSLLLPEGFEGTPLRKSFVLAARAVKAWPGAKEPGESGAGSPSRRKVAPPGVPDPAWGPRRAPAAGEAQGAAQAPGADDAPGEVAR